MDDSDDRGGCRIMGACGGRLLSGGRPSF